MDPVSNKAAKVTPGKRSSREPGAPLFIALVAITLVGPLSIHLFLPALPHVRQTFAVSESTAQLTFSLAVVAMAFARTYLGVHWLTDTLAGAIVGAGVAVFVWALWAPRLQHESRRHPAARGEAPQSGARRGGGAVAQESRRGSG